MENDWLTDFVHFNIGEIFILSFGTNELLNLRVDSYSIEYMRTCFNVDLKHASDIIKLGSVV